MVAAPSSHRTRDRERERDYWPGTEETAEPEPELPVLALAGVAPSSTVTLEIFQTPLTCWRSAVRRTTSEPMPVILLLA